MATPGDISKLDVVLTAGCNLRCSYCYQNDKKPKRMDWETLQASADSCCGPRVTRSSCCSSAASRCSNFRFMQRAVGDNIVASGGRASVCSSRS